MWVWLCVCVCVCLVCVSVRVVKREVVVELTWAWMKRSLRGFEVPQKR